MGVAETWVDEGLVWTYGGGLGEHHHLAYFGNSIVVGVCQEKIWRSINGGAAWTEISFTPGNPNMNQLKRVLSCGGGKGLALQDGDPGWSAHSLITSDYGATWTDTDRPYPTISALLWAVHLGSGEIIVYPSSGGNQARSTNYGATWTQEPGKWVGWPVYGADYNAATNVLIAVTNGGGAGSKILRSTDKGANYSTIMDTGAGGATMIPVIHLGSGVWLIGRWSDTAGPRMWRSVDDGLTWGFVTGAVPSDQSGCYQFVNFGGGTIVCMDVAAGTVRIMVSHDYGLTWADSGMGAIYGALYDGCYISGTLGLISGGYGHVYTTGSAYVPPVVTGIKVGFRWRKYNSTTFAYSDFWQLFYTQGAGTNRSLYLYNPVSSKIVLTVDPTDDVLQVNQSLLSHNEIRALSPGGTFYSGFKSALLGANVIWDLPALDGTAGQFMMTDGAKHLVFSNAISLTPVLGDIIYANATPAWTKLAGNTTASLMFLAQTGTGAVSAAPVWTALTAAMVPLTSNYIGYGISSVLGGSTEFQILKNAGESTVIVSGADNIFKNFRLTDSTSGEKWDISHRTHADGNRYELWYNDGANWYLRFSLNTSGQITTASWHATTIDVDHGGTGATTHTSGYLLKGNAAAAISASVIYDNGTNIGIGTATITYRCNINGTLWLLNDNDVIYLGAGKDMAFYYDGTSGYIDASVVAPSDIHVDCGQDKTIVLDETVWDDLRIVPGSFDRPGVSDPTIIAYDVNGGGVSTYLWQFTKDNIASFSVQLPHGWKEGTNIKVHIHWTPGPRGNEENGHLVGWKIDYSWANIDGTFGNMATADLSDACNGVDDEHNMTPEVAIAGAGQTLSSMLICNVKRTDTGADDTWASENSGERPMLLEIDFHFEIDTIGSRQASAK